MSDGMECSVGSGMFSNFFFRRWTISTETDDVEEHRVHDRCVNGQCNTA